MDEHGSSMNASTAQPKASRRKKVRVFLVWAALSIATLYLVVSLVWRFTGSNQWELKAESHGVKVYTLKSPGSDRVLYKANFRVRSSLSAIVAAFQDPNACEGGSGCESKMVKRIDDQLIYFYLKGTPSSWVRPRDVVVRTLTHQNAATKEVLVEVVAVADMAPRDECCVRVVDMSNYWKFSPVENGWVDVEYSINVDVGLPHALLYLWLPDLLTKQRGYFQRLFSATKYREARLDYIQEP